MSITTLVMIGMVEIFLIACFWINTWKYIAQAKMVHDNIRHYLKDEHLDEHLDELERIAKKVTEHEKYK